MFIIATKDVSIVTRNDDRGDKISRITRNFNLKQRKAKINNHLQSAPLTSDFRNSFTFGICDKKRFDMARFAGIWVIFQGSNQKSRLLPLTFCRI